jgi:nitrogen regulatory protein PII
MSDDRKPQAPLKFLVFIIDWSKIKVVSSVFETEQVRFNFITKARGTASSEILDLLGIGSSEKAVVICIEQEIMIPLLLKEVRKKLGFHNAGAGIAFTVPLSSVHQPVLQILKDADANNPKLKNLKESEKVSNEVKHDLIVSIINQGYSDEFMTAAREAGAAGGTVINARGLANQGPIKFFGVSVQDEKEIILIVTNRDRKTAIMQAVSQSYGINSEAAGVIFSLPVDTLIGLNVNIE